MIRAEKLQAFICILVSFLVYGLTCYGLSLTITRPIQGEPFSFTLSKKIPLPDRERQPVSLPLWQVNESNISFAQSATVISSTRVPAKSPGNVRSALCYYHRNADSSHAEISLCIIDTPNTAFTFVNGLTCQHLDIPPPHALASL